MPISFESGNYYNWVRRWPCRGDRRWLADFSESYTMCTERTLVERNNKNSTQTSHRWTDHKTTTHEYNFYKPRDTRTIIDSTHIGTWTRLLRKTSMANGKDTTLDHDHDFTDQEQNNDQVNWTALRPPPKISRFFSFSQKCFEPKLGESVYVLGLTPPSSCGGRSAGPKVSRIPIL